MNEQIELRVLQTNLQTDSETMMVEGLVNKTGSWSETLGKVKRFKEKIDKGVFKRAIEKNPVIDFLGEHDSRYLLASTVNDSLELWEDEEGLKMRARISNTSYGRDFFTHIKEGILGHMSFGFKVAGQEWRKLLDGTYERIITDMELFEISVVRTPAYSQSTISARGLDVIEDVEIPNDLVEEKREEEKVEEPKEEIQKEEDNNSNEKILWEEVINQLKKNNEFLESLLSKNSNSDEIENISENKEEAEETDEESPIENSEEEIKEAAEEENKEDNKEENSEEKPLEEKEVNFDLAKQKEILSKIQMEDLDDED